MFFVYMLILFLVLCLAVPFVFMAICVTIWASSLFDDLAEGLDISDEDV